jgi:phosphoribosyl 1,2-cyclic phosphodiesterase
MNEPPLDSPLRRRHENCVQASIGDPRHNRNYRCNPSILIQYQHNTSREYNIIIDTGKTFRESILRWFPINRVRSVDAVLLTHGHADAIFGLDDIRSVQPLDSNTPMPVYLSKECEAVVRKVFFYLFPSPDKSPSESLPLISHSLSRSLSL